MQSYARHVNYTIFLLFPKILKFDKNKFVRLVYRIWEKCLLDTVKLSETEVIIYH